MEIKKSSQTYPLKSVVLSGSYDKGLADPMISIWRLFKKNKNSPVSGISQADLPRNSEMKVREDHSSLAIVPIERVAVENEGIVLATEVRDIVQFPILDPLPLLVSSGELKELRYIVGQPLRSVGKVAWIPSVLKYVSIAKFLAKKCLTFVTIRSSVCFGLAALSIAVFVYYYFLRKEKKGDDTLIKNHHPLDLIETKALSDKLSQILQKSDLVSSNATSVGECISDLRKEAQYESKKNFKRKKIEFFDGFSDLHHHYHLSEHILRARSRFSSIPAPNNSPFARSSSSSPYQQVRFPDLVGQNYSISRNESDSPEFLLGPAPVGPENSENQSEVRSPGSQNATSVSSVRESKLLPIHESGQEKAYDSDSSQSELPVCKTTSVSPSTCINSMGRDQFVGSLSPQSNRDYSVLDQIDLELGCSLSVNPYQEQKSPTLTLRNRLNSYEKQDTASEVPSVSPSTRGNSESRVALEVFPPKVTSIPGFNFAAIPTSEHEDPPTKNMSQGYRRTPSGTPRENPSTPRIDRIQLDPPNRFVTLVHRQAPRQVLDPDNGTDLGQKEENMSVPVKEIIKRGLPPHMNRLNLVKQSLRGDRDGSPDPTAVISSVVPKKIPSESPLNVSPVTIPQRVSDLPPMMPPSTGQENQMGDHEQKGAVRVATPPKLFCGENRRQLSDCNLNPLSVNRRASSPLRSARILDPSDSKISGAKRGKKSSRDHGQKGPVTVATPPKLFNSAFRTTSSSGDSSSRPSVERGDPPLF